VFLYLLGTRSRAANVTATCPAIQVRWNMTNMQRGLAVLALLLVVAACGDSQDAAELPPVGDDVPPPAGACEEGTVDCNDTLFPGGEPQGGITPGGDSAGMPAGGGLSVSEALQTDAIGPIAVHGFYVDSGTGPMLCEALAESFPPQCGGASIPLADISAIDPDSIRTDQGVSWSDNEVFIVGEIVDGVFVPTEMSQ